MTRTAATIPERRRKREGWEAMAAIGLATVAGLVAAHFGTRQSWENPPATASTPTSVPFVDPQRIP
jgi:hypothetical protein